MSNVRAEVLRVSRTRSGWRESGNQKPSQRPYISNLKSTFESGHPDKARTDGSKGGGGGGGGGGGESVTKPSRLGGTKVSTIANMFQAMTPTKEDVYHARPGFAKPESPKSEHVRKPSAHSEEPPVDNQKNERRGSAQDGCAPPTTVHLNRTESHLARFNNARAMFERLQEQSQRTKGGYCGNSKKRSGSVSPSRSSPIRTTFSPTHLSRSPSPGETQSVGCSPKHDSPLSPRDKSRSADSILGERNRENAATFGYHSSHLNGRRQNLNLDLNEYGAGEAIISPGPLSPRLASFLLPSPLDDSPTTNGTYMPKGFALEDRVVSESTSDAKSKCFYSPVKPSPLSPKPTDIARASAVVAKAREPPPPPTTTKEISPSSSPKILSTKFVRSTVTTRPSDKLPGATSARSPPPPAATSLCPRPRVVSATPAAARARLADDRSRSHIPQLQKDSSLAARRAAARTTSPSQIEGSSSSRPESGPTLLSAIEKKPDESNSLPSPTSPDLHGIIAEDSVTLPNGPARAQPSCETSAVAEAQAKPAKSVVELPPTLLTAPSPSLASENLGTTSGPQKPKAPDALARTQPVPQEEELVIPPPPVPPRGAGEVPEAAVQPVSTKSYRAPSPPSPSVDDGGSATTSSLRDRPAAGPPSESGSQTLVLSTDGMPYSAKDLVTPPVIAPSMPPCPPSPRDEAPIDSLEPALLKDVSPLDVELATETSAVEQPPLPETVAVPAPDLADLNQQWSEAIQQLTPKSSSPSSVDVTPIEEPPVPRTSKSVEVNNQGTSPLSPPWEEHGAMVDHCKEDSKVLGLDTGDADSKQPFGDHSVEVDGKKPEPEIMTPEEADQLLSSSEILSDEEATEVKMLLKEQEIELDIRPKEVAELEKEPVTSQVETPEDDGSCMDPAKPENEVRQPPIGQEESDSDGKSEEAEEEEEEEEPVDEYDEYDVDGAHDRDEVVHYLEDGHFWVEVPGLPDSDEDEVIDTYQTITVPKKRERVKFSTKPIRVYSTFSVNDYDRRNDDVDPVSASAEYELEKRVEKMDVFPVELLKGSEGLGLSIIGMGVGADSGLEKLGIFVKTITEGGAAHKDSRIRVNDQIIEVDGKSLVGVTQAYAASVLRNTSGLVRFLIGRERDGENSEVAQLISQSLQADRERDERRKALEQELQQQQQQRQQSGENESRGDGYPGLTLPIPSLAVQPPNAPHIMVQEDSTPEEGEDGPTCEVFDLEDESSESPSPDSDVTTLRIKLKEAQYKNAVTDAEIAKAKSKVAMLEALQAEHEEYEKRLHMLTLRLAEMDKEAENTRKQMMTYQDMLEESQGQYILLEKKYYKAKKLIKEFQQRQQDLFHREEYHLQQLQEKDQEYNALVKSLKDRVIQLEQDLMETQKAAGLPVRLPYDNTSIKQLQLTPQQLRKPHVINQKRTSAEADMSDSELSDADLAKYDISPDSDEAENKTSTVERKPSCKDDVFEKAVPQTELLDSTAAKAKAELASKGSLANRQPPSIKKTGSTGSSGDGTSLDQKDSDSSTSLGSSREDLNESLEPSLGDKTSTSTSASSDSSPAGTPLPSLDGNTSPQKTTQFESIISPESDVSAEHHRPVGRVKQVAALTQKRIMASLTVTSQQEVRTTHVKIDDRFAEEMRIILERKNLEAKRQMISEDVDQFGIPVDRTHGHHHSSLTAMDIQKNLTTSPGSTTSTHSTASNATGNSDIGVSFPKSTDTSLPVYSMKRDSSSSGCARFCPQAEPNPRGAPLSCCCLPGAAHTADSQLLERSVFSTGSDVEGFSTGAKTQQPHSVISELGTGSGVIPGSLPERRPHQWLSCSVLEWSAAQVGQWLLALSMEQYIAAFLDGNINGQELVNMDGTKLKALGVISGNDRSVLKKKIKELKGQLDKERKAAEKEQRAREKLLRKAEKAAEKASKKK